MPIAASDIHFRFSGGASNNSPAASLGGAMSSNQITDNVQQNLFDDVSGAESTAGDIEYRAFYVLNNHGSLTLVDARVYFSSSPVTAAAGTDMHMALAGEAINTTIETVANEDTAPVGETFTQPTTYTGGLQLNGSGGLAPADDKGVWLRRTTTAGASAAADSATVKVEGDTAA
jgi:hypothetical protein